MGHRGRRDDLAGPHNLFRYCEGIIYFDAEISERAYDLCMSEQKLDGPEIPRPPIDQGGFGPSRRKWIAL
jgi:hypothetical protein